VAPVDGERFRFVLPVNGVEIKESCELSLGVVCELRVTCPIRAEEIVDSQWPDTSAMRGSADVSPYWSGKSL